MTYSRRVAISVVGLAL